MIVLPTIRPEGSFQRTACACELCACFCKVMPGYLLPSDLARMIPPGADPLAWAREHLRASEGSKVGDAAKGIVVQIPALVPAHQANGHCHWFTADEKCAVHTHSPFGCGYFDQHMSAAEAEARDHFARVERAKAFAEESLYGAIWHLLKSEGLVGGGEERYRQAVAMVSQIRAKKLRVQQSKERDDRRKEKKRKRQR
jgi:hypothetical protein